MTIKEIHSYCSAERNEMRKRIDVSINNENHMLENKLAEVGLDGRVRHKKTGHIGELHVDVRYCPYIKFYPLTKKGLVSKKPEYHYGDSKNIEDVYEPYKED